MEHENSAYVIIVTVENLSQVEQYDKRVRDGAIMDVDVDVDIDVVIETVT